MQTISTETSKRMPDCWEASAARSSWPKEGEGMFKRAIRLVGLAAALVLLTAGVSLADAGGQGTVTITTHDHDVVLDSESVTNPCSGAPGTITLTAKNEVFHETSFTNGDEFWGTSTVEGTATFTPDDPDGVSASGHFEGWFGESSNNNNDVQHFTNTVHLTGSDGSRLTDHEIGHLSTNANGVVTVSFDRETLSCDNPITVLSTGN